MFFCFLYLFVRWILFNSLFFILFSMYILHCLVVWCCLEYIPKKKINRFNLRSTLVLAFLWFKFCRSTLESCFCVDFRFYHFSFIIFLCWTFRSKFSSKILIRKKKHKNLSVNHLIHVVLESCLVIVIVTLCSKFVLNFYFVDWILDTFVHVFLSFLAYLLNFESNSCMLFSS